MAEPAERNEGAAADAAPSPQVEYSLSTGLVGRLAQLNVSLAFLLLPVGILYFVGRNPNGGAHLHQRRCPSRWASGAILPSGASGILSRPAAPPV